MPKPTRTPERIEIGGGFNLKQLDNGNYTLHWADGERFNGAHVLSPQEAAALQSPAGEWRSMDKHDGSPQPVLTAWSLSKMANRARSIHGWCMHVAYFKDGNWYYSGKLGYPTHWLPLPPAPTGEG